MLSSEMQHSGPIKTGMDTEIIHLLQQKAMPATRHLGRPIKTDLVALTAMVMVIQTVMQVGPQHRVQTPSRVNQVNGLIKTEMVMETTQVE
tara:strand:- start:325 stop:597 length:273 start_codon:yes stop_codon:yes gene_type:complete